MEDLQIQAFPVSATLASFSGGEDAFLVTRAIGGDREAFSELASRHRQAAHRTALAVVGPDRAEDVVQEALLVAYRFIGKLNDPEKFRAWLVRITLHKARRAGRLESRHRSGRIPLDDRTVERKAAGTGDARSAGDEHAALLEAIDRIPSIYGETVRHHFLSGLPHLEIAGMLGVPLSTVKWRCFRGKELLRSVLLGSAPSRARIRREGCLGCDGAGGSTGPSPCDHASAPKVGRRKVRALPSLRSRVAKAGGLWLALFGLIEVLLSLGAGLEAAGAPAAGQARFQVASAESIELPDVTLVDQDGRKVRLVDALTGPGPVGLNFFFASCQSICPVMTSTFAGMRDRLGSETENLRLVSITIDPDQDSPEVLRSYGRRFAAGPGWSFLTGEPDEVARILRAFRADSGGKFNHRPLFFFRSPVDGAWVRVEGLAGSADLAGVVRSLPRTAASAN